MAESSSPPERAVRTTPLQKILRFISAACGALAVVNLVFDIGRPWFVYVLFGLMVLFFAASFARSSREEGVSK